MMQILVSGRECWKRLRLVWGLIDVEDIDVETR